MPGPETETMRAQRDNYDREIRIVDDELRKLFGALDAEEPGASTIVVILADHGEEFAEHGGFQHGASVYEECLHVPLIFWGPGRIPAGRRHSTLVSLVDVAPTIAELAELSVAEDLDGRSLLGVLLEGESLPPRALFAEAQATRRWLDPIRYEEWNPPLVAVRTPGSKFIVHRPRSGAALPTIRFDLVNDPKEESPLPVEPERARAVESMVGDYLRRRTPAAGVPAESADVSPDLRMRLRALGYVE